MPNMDAKPQQTEGYLSRDLGDEYLFYDQNGDQVHVLNGTAREIYLLCDGKNSIADIIGRMIDQYDIDGETANKDVSGTVDQLLGLGLLSI